MLMPLKYQSGRTQMVTALKMTSLESKWYDPLKYQSGVEMVEPFELRIPVSWSRNGLTDPLKYQSGVEISDPLKY